MFMINIPSDSKLCLNQMEKCEEDGEKSQVICASVQRIAQEFHALNISNSIT